MTDPAATGVDQIDPDLVEATHDLPSLPLTSAPARAAIRVALSVSRVPSHPDVKVRVLRRGRLRLRLYWPRERTSRAALLWVHGGGYVIGHPRMDEQLCADTAAQLGVLVISVDYRLAPRHPFPAALDDAVGAWNWLLASAGQLGVDASRLAVGGMSAGGGLAAALVNRVRDTGGPQPVAQWLFCPMLDDRTAADRSLDALQHPVWDNGRNRFGWRSYLGVEPGSPAVPLAAVPARRTELAGSPPTFIGVGDIDLFHDEDVRYAEALRSAGAAVTLDVVPGAPHGFTAVAYDARPSQAHLGRARDWLASALQRPDPSLEERSTAPAGRSTAPGVDGGPLSRP